MQKNLIRIIRVVLAIGLLNLSCRFISLPPKMDFSPTSQVESVLKSNIQLYDYSGTELLASDFEIESANIGGMPFVYITDPKGNFLPVISKPTSETMSVIILPGVDQGWDVYYIGESDIDLSSLETIASDIPLEQVPDKIESLITGTNFSLLVLHHQNDQTVPSKFNLYQTKLPNTFVLAPSDHRSQKLADHILGISPVYAADPLSITVTVMIIGYLGSLLVPLIAEIYLSQNVFVPDVIGEKPNRLLEYHLALAKHGLQMEVREEVCNDPSKDGLIIKQDPAPHTKISATKQNLIVYVCRYTTKSQESARLSIHDLIREGFTAIYKLESESNDGTSSYSSYGNIRLVVESIDRNGKINISVYEDSYHPLSGHSTSNRSQIIDITSTSCLSWFIYPDGRVIQALGGETSYNGCTTYVEPYKAILESKTAYSYNGKEVQALVYKYEHKSKSVCNDYILYNTTQYIFYYHLITGLLLERSSVAYSNFQDNYNNYNSKLTERTKLVETNPPLP